MSSEVQIKVNIIQDQIDMDAARSIRETVFVIEQKVPFEIEYDEFETIATHILARITDEAVGTARWRQTQKGYKLERFAVHKSARGFGVGKALVEFILDRLEEGIPAYLNSQVSALGFYASLGFVARGDVFFEADIPHREMILKR